MKKVKKQQTSSASGSESGSSQESSSREKHKKKRKKKKKQHKKLTKELKVRVDSSVKEEGELESDFEELNPMVSVTKIDPSEIPEVTNKFLMRSEEILDQKTDKVGNERKFGWSKRQIPQSRSGRQIKGRGSFRYRTPSRSRSRSLTPEHWKAASRKLIKLTDYEKIAEEKKVRDEEIKRRTEERKKRHEAASVAKVEPPNIEGKGNNDPNELDYEVDEEEFRNKRSVITQKDTKKRGISSHHDDRDKRDYRAQDKDRRSRERETLRSRSKNR